MDVSLLDRFLFFSIIGIAALLSYSELELLGLGYSYLNITQKKKVTQNRKCRGEISAEIQLLVELNRKGLI